MNSKRAFLAALAIATAPLAACSGGNDTVETPSGDEIALEVSNARLVLPPVSGNPAAIYFDVENVGDRNYAIRAVEVAGSGSAELHGSMETDGKMMMDGVGQVLVNSGTTESLEPGGFHVMVYDLDPGLEAGGTTEMTLTVVGGKVKTFPVEIRAAGADR